MTISQNAEELDWEPPMLPTDLIFDDGEPLESNRHRRPYKLGYILYERGGVIID